MGADGGEWVSGQWVSVGGISYNLRGNITGEKQPRIHLRWESHLSAMRGHHGRVISYNLRICDAWARRARGIKQFLWEYEYHWAKKQPRIHL